MASLLIEDKGKNLEKRTERRINFLEKNITINFPPKSFYSIIKLIKFFLQRVIILEIN